MENKKIKALIDYAKQNLSVDIVQDLIDSTVYHAYVVDNEMAKGFGSAEDPSLALVKAVAEHVERGAFHSEWLAKRALNSSGFAAHWSQDTARDKARLEIIERDAFLCSWLAEQAPFWLSHDELLAFDLHELVEKQKLFQNRGFSIHFGVIGVSGQDFVLVGCLDSSNRLDLGFAIDTCAGSDLRQMIRKVYRTLCYYASHLLKRFQSTGQWFEPHLSRILEVTDHFEYFLAPKNRPEWFFKRSPAIAIIPPLATHAKIVTECPHTGLVVAKAHADSFQEFFIGETSLEKVNLPRLRLVFPNVVKLNLSTHPLA